MKIIGMVSTLNDEDIIGEVIEHLISQGIQLVVLDNGSDDETFNICKNFLGKGLLSLKKYSTISYIYNWGLLLRMLYDMALIHNPDWVIRSDSDEFLESGLRDVTIRDAIAEADKQKYNLIQFDRFDFFMTDDDTESSRSIREKLRYYSCHGDCLYRAWKYAPGITIGNAGGHWPIFPNGLKYKIFPRKFVMRHYTFRSKEQAEKKMADRTRGASFDKNKDGVNIHMQNILEQDFTQKFDHRLLTKYEEDNKWNYEINFHPYMDTFPPKRDEIFTKDGQLKAKQKSIWEYHMELQNAYVKIQELKTLKGFLKLGKKSILKRFKIN